MDSKDLLNDTREDGEPAAKVRKICQQITTSEPCIGRTDSFTLVDNNVLGLLDNVLNVIDLNSTQNIDSNCNEDHNRNLPSTSTLSVITKLEEVLWSSSEGKGIYRYYKHHQCFDETHRKRLASLIIQYEIDQATVGLSLNGDDKLKEFILTTDQFKEYANLIVTLFPTEVTETYYIPSYYNNKERILSTGRLWDCFNNAKRRLRRDYLLEKPNDNDENKPKKDIISEEMKKNIQRLRAGITLELEDLILIWRDSFEVRRETYKTTNQSPFSYFEEYKYLKTDYGKHLIKSDFYTLFPKHSELLKERFPLATQTLIQLLKNAKNIKGTDQGYLAIISKLDPDHQVAVILYLLPYIIPAGRRSKPKKAEAEDALEPTEYVEPKIDPAKRMSIRQNAFTVVVPINKTIKDEHKKIVQQLKKKKQSLQPTIFVKGTIIDIQSIKVFIDDTSYSVSSYIEAVDLCFKLFFVLDCTYPFEAAALWNFIQSTFYDIGGPKQGPAVRAIEGDLRRAFAKN